MRSLVIVAALALLSLPVRAQTTVPAPQTPPNQPLPGQLPTPSVITIVPSLPPPPWAEPVPGFGGRTPFSDTSPSGRPAGMGGQALGDTSPIGSARAIGEGGRAFGDTSPSSFGAPALRMPGGPAPNEPGYTGSAVGVRRKTNGDLRHWVIHAHPSCVVYTNV